MVSKAILVVRTRYTRTIIPMYILDSVPVPVPDSGNLSRPSPIPGQALRTLRPSSIISSQTIPTTLVMPSRIPPYLVLPSPRALRPPAATEHGCPGRRVARIEFFGAECGSFAASASHSFCSLCHPHPLLGVDDGILPNIPNDTVTISCAALMDLLRTFGATVAQNRGAVSDPMGFTSPCTIFIFRSSSSHFDFWGSTCYPFGSTFYRLYALSFWGSAPHPFGSACDRP